MRPLRLLGPDAEAAVRSNMPSGIGNQNCVANGKLNPGGITPITVASRSSALICRPRTVRSPAYRRCQMP